MFKIGQKVVCVEPIYSLIKGEIYTISNIYFCQCGNESLGLIEYVYADSEVVFNSNRCIKCDRLTPVSKSSFRFRPLDHAFADEVIKMICEQPETIGA